MAILQFDIEDPSWGDIISSPYDLVHIRTLLGSIHNECWPTIYRNIFQYVYSHQITHLHA